MVGKSEWLKLVEMFWELAVEILSSPATIAVMLFAIAAQLSEVKDALKGIQNLMPIPKEREKDPDMWELDDEAEDYDSAGEG